MALRHSAKAGFTLLEILLVVAAIAILAGIVITAINPAKQLADTRNAQRRSDVIALVNAVYQYAIDNSGVLPATISTASTEICKTGAINCAGLIDLNVLTVNQKYLTALPKDPNGTCNVSGICYKIMKSEDGRITVSAPNAENAAVISATK